MKQKPKLWIALFLGVVMVVQLLSAAVVYYFDPFFHYHAPKHTDTLFYPLDNERSQNNGIVRFFSYDAVITGSSMAEGLLNSEMDALFGTNSIKVCFTGGKMKETNDNLELALNSNPELKTIIRALDMTLYLDKWDAKRTDLGTYPTYLYDRNPFNDVNYLFNRDLLPNRIYTMISESRQDEHRVGLTSFDDYSNWTNGKDPYGIEAVCPNNMPITAPGEPQHLTDAERETVRENIERNVSNLPAQYPDVQFYYFIPPYSAVWWQDILNKGTIYKQVEAEQMYIESLLPYENVHLFSWNTRTDITTDLNHYIDIAHYGPWVSSYMLRCMYEDAYRLTPENYLEYLQQELTIYTTFDYASMNGQPDYENDFDAAAALQTGDLTAS